jgi:ABC-type multidrug transport system ATPase subunit
MLRSPFSYSSLPLTLNSHRYSILPLVGRALIRYRARSDGDALQRTRAHLAAVLPIALELRSVTRRYRAGVAGCSGAVTALDRVSLTVAAGECVGVAGAPGAGKSTLLLCAAGILRPDEGSVRSLTAAFVARRGSSEAQLGSHAALTHALGAAPRVLCLDDPLSLLDAPARDRYVALLNELRAAGIAVLVSGRDPAALAASASRVITLDAGRILRATARRRTLELEVGMPSFAAAALAGRIPSVRRLGHALRVALDDVTAEQVLSECRQLGIRVHGSRVITTAAAGRVAEPD